MGEIQEQIQLFGAFGRAATVDRSVNLTVRGCIGPGTRRRAHAFVGQPLEPASHLLIPATVGNVPAEAGVGEQTFGDFRRLRHSTSMRATGCSGID
jgi:hypothetical protein